MASNTKILIKRSDSSANPSYGSLEKGELAYSYQSNTLFIGDDSMSGYKVIGGQGLLASLSANLTLTDAASNTSNVNLATDSLNFRGTGIITANVVTDMFGEPEVRINIDDTAYIKANTGTSFQKQIISTGLQIDGDLIVNGTTTAINSTTVSTGDTILVLANNNTIGDSVDTGFVARYNDGVSNLFSGLVRDSSAGGDYALFQNYDTMGSGFTGVTISSIDSGSTGSYANLHANLVSQDVTTSKLNLNTNKIALGSQSSVYGQGIAIGFQANANTGDDIVNVDAIAIGTQANYGGGAGLAGSKSIAIGYQAVASNTYSIAIGNKAEATRFNDMSQVGSIVLNATNFTLTSANTGFYVNPVREVHPEDYDLYDGIAMYNSSTKEMRFTHTLDGGTF
jgi:hypothetical protein